MAEQQFTRRTCDHCGHNYNFPQGNYTITDMDEILRWVGTVGFRKIGNDQLEPILKHYCRAECAISALANPPAEEETQKDISFIANLGGHRGKA